jgi:YcxB-like protein
MQESLPAMSVTFELTPADLRAFQKHASRVMPAYRRGRWVVIIFIAVISYFPAASASADQSLPIKLLTYAIVCGSIWLFSFIVSRLIHFLNIVIGPDKKGLSGILCQHNITIDPEGLTELTPVNQGRHYWKGIYRVDTTPEHIFIYIQQNQAHVIPKRFFASPSVADLFFQTAVNYYRTATQSITIN